VAKDKTRKKAKKGHDERHHAKGNSWWPPSEWRSGRRTLSQEDLPMHTGSSWTPPAGAAPAAPPAPPPDPAFVAMLLEASTDIKVYKGLGDLSALSKSRTLFLTGKGLVTVLDTPIGIFVSAHDKQEGPTPGLATPPAGVTLKVPALPWEALLQTVAFFREVMERHNNAEALIQWFWDPVAATYVPHVPQQQVSAGSVHHQGSFDAVGNLLHIFDIHSHNTMGAFWSGTDDADEARFEGRLFGVIGQLDKSIPAFKWRCRVGGTFVDLDMGEVVDLPPTREETQTVTIDYANLLSVASGSKSKHNTQFVYHFDPFEGATFPPAWMEQLTTPTAITRVTGYGYTGAGGHDWSGRDAYDYAATGLVEVAPGVWTTKAIADKDALLNAVEDAAYAAKDRMVGDTRLVRPTTFQTTRWAYDRIKGHLYFEGVEGLYPSTLDVVKMHDTYPNAVLRFFDDITKERINPHVKALGRRS
jgi:hypothetical protein